MKVFGMNWLPWQATAALMASQSNLGASMKSIGQSPRVSSDPTQLMLAMKLGTGVELNRTVYSLTGTAPV